MSKNPIPKDALDDRLAFIGTSGSGKTFAAKGRVEQLLKLGHRVVIVDPLDVWWGLRADLTGKKAAFDVAILGGKHADMQITELSGALIGEAVAKSKDSCIVSLGSLKTQAKRQRFMLAFLDALYENTDPETADPYHVVFDEADLWAPQKPMGQEAMLCHLMEEIVRRGRVKGFIPWFITQRPAVLNKNVLSQADGLIALQLTSSQDRKAIRAWVESTADEGQWAELDKALPSFAQGQGVVWIPSLGMLEKVAFPPNETFDSSRTPKRGEKKRTADLKPLNIEALRAKLATVEKETKENDPTALKALVVQLRAELAKKPAIAAPAAPAKRDLAALAAERAAGEAAGRSIFAAAIKAAMPELRLALKGAVEKALSGMTSSTVNGVWSIADGLEGDILKRIPKQGGRVAVAAAKAYAASAAIPIVGPLLAPPASPRAPLAPPAIHDASLGKAKQHILDTLAWWESLGRTSADKDVIAFLAGVSPKSSGHQNNMGALRSAGLLDYPGPGLAQLTNDGRARANTPAALLDSAALQSAVLAQLNPPMRAILELVLDGKERSKTELATELGVSANSSGHQNNLGRLRSLGFITYPGPGRVAVSPSMFI